MTDKYPMNLAQVTEYLGSDATEEMVIETYQGMTLSEIHADLNEMFPGDSNRFLAVQIHRLVN